VQAAEKGNADAKANLMQLTIRQLGSARSR